MIQYGILFGLILASIGIVLSKKIKLWEYFKFDKKAIVATALAKKYDETISIFENHLLDEWIHKKAIQKAIGSYRVSDEHKKYLRSLK